MSAYTGVTDFYKQSIFWPTLFILYMYAEAYIKLCCFFKSFTTEANTKCFVRGYYASDIP